MYRRIHRARPYQPDTKLDDDRWSLGEAWRHDLEARDESQDEDTAWHLLGVNAFGHSTGHDSGIVSISTFGGWNSPAPKSFVIVKDSSTVPDDIIFTNYNPSYKITATSFSSMGQVLCRTGATTGTECGEVSDLGLTKAWHGPTAPPIHTIKWAI